MKFRTGLRLSAAAFVLANVAAPMTAQAQSLERMATGLTDILQTAIDVLPGDVTNLRLGLGPAVGTDYEGSDHYRVDPVPVISLRYRDLIEVDNNEVKIIAFNQLFGSSADMGGGKLRAGPLVSVNFGRSAGKKPDLRGMGNVGTAFELGAFVSYTFNDTRIRVRGRQDVASGHNGATVILDVTQALIRGENYAVGAAISGTWASTPYMRAFFGVSPAQATASGYTVYRPGSAFKDVSFGLNGSYAFTKEWSVVATAGYKRLLGSAADSPIVRGVGSPNQLGFSTFVVYTF